MPGSRWSRVGPLLVVAALLAACTSAPPASLSAGGPATLEPQATAGASAAAGPLDTARGELDRALDRLESIHPEPFHAVDRATFVGALDELKSNLDSLAPEAAAVELMRIWALLAQERDGHQFALPLDDEDDLILPIRVYEFADGVFVTDAMAPNRDLAGSRLVTIGATPIDEVLARLEPLVPRDGPATVPAFRPLFLLHVVVLRGLGLVPAGPVQITVEGPDGQREVSLEPVPSAEFREWAAWLPFTGLPPRDGLRSTLASTENLTVEMLGDSVVYARYRQVQRIDGAALQRLADLAAEPAIERVIVDIRQNPGGNNNTYPPLVTTLAELAAEYPGRLVLLTDRVTFSAASNFATVIEQETDAAFVGEPMGGGLNFWNDVDWINLPDFVVPMRVAVSTRYWEKSTPDDERLTIQPDLELPMQSADYFAGRDPVLDAALAADLS